MWGTVKTQTASALLWLPLALSACQQHARFVVTTTDDRSNHSLRAAIDWANGVDSRQSDGVVIELAPGEYRLSRCGTDDSNGAGDLDLTTDLPVVLRGAGPDVVIRQTCAGERVLDTLGEGLVTLSGITVSGGNLTGTDPSLPVRGGGIRAAANLVLQGAAVTGNSAQGLPGQAASAGGLAIAGTTAFGGGVFVQGELIAIDSTILQNTARGGDGAEPEAGGGVVSLGGEAQGGGAYVAGGIELQRSSIRDNQALGALGAQARGGGMAQDLSSTAPVRISGSSFSGNLAKAGATVRGNLEGGALGSGGALAVAGALTGESLDATANQAIGGAGALRNRHTLASPGAGRGGAIAAAGDVHLMSSSVVLNAATGGGFELDECFLTYPPGVPPIPSNPCEWVQPSEAAVGEAPALWVLGSLTIEGGTYSANASVTGINRTYVVLDHKGQLQPRGVGGPVGATIVCAGSVRISGSELAHNRLLGTLLPGELLRAPDATLTRTRVSRNDGGLAIAGHISLSETLFASNSETVRARTVEATDSTFEDVEFGIRATDSVTLVNTTVSSARQVAVITDRLSLEHATIVDSYGSSFAGGVVISARSLKSQASVVTAPENSSVCAPDTIIESSSYNFFSDTSCALSGTGDRQAMGPPLLEALKDNGGAVPTRLPLPASPLVDQVPSGACTLAHDARGVARPQGTACDVGAVETQASAAR